MTGIDGVALLGEHVEWIEIEWLGAPMPRQALLDQIRTVLPEPDFTATLVRRPRWAAIPRVRVEMTPPRANAQLWRRLRDALPEAHIDRWGWGSWFRDSSQPCWTPMPRQRIRA